jgi:hypothetical protein
LLADGLVTSAHAASSELRAATLRRTLMRDVMGTAKRRRGSLPPGKRHDYDARPSQWHGTFRESECVFLFSTHCLRTTYECIPICFVTTGVTSCCQCVSRRYSRAGPAMRCWRDEMRSRSTEQSCEWRSTDARPARVGHCVAGESSDAGLYLSRILEYLAWHREPGIRGRRLSPDAQAARRSRGGRGGLGVAHLYRN